MTWQEVDVRGEVWSSFWDDHPMVLQQSSPYGFALMAFGGIQKQLVLGEAKNPKAVVQIMERKAYGFLTSAVVFFGPHWRDPSMSFDEKVSALNALKKKYPKLKANFLSLMPFEEETPEVKGLMATIGTRKTITGYSTILVDLDKSEKELRAQLKGKWRNALVTAEKADIKVVLGGKNPRKYNWLLEQEDAQRLDVKYTGLPTELVGHYGLAASNIPNHGILSLTALKDDQKIAGQLFLRHGNTATYFIGWNGDEGRANSAHNLLLFKAMMHLKNKGVKWFDLGGLNTENGAGIARFKLGVGVEPKTFAGSYV